MTSLHAHNPSRRDHWKQYEFVFHGPVFPVYVMRIISFCICGTQSPSDLWLQRGTLTNHLYFISISCSPVRTEVAQALRGALSRKTDTPLTDVLRLRAPQGLGKL